MWSLHVILRLLALGSRVKWSCMGCPFEMGMGLTSSTLGTCWIIGRKALDMCIISKLILNSNQDINCNVGASL